MVIWCGVEMEKSTGMKRYTSTEHGDGDGDGMEYDVDKPVPQNATMNTIGTRIQSE